MCRFYFQSLQFSTWKLCHKVMASIMQKIAMIFTEQFAVTQMWCDRLNAVLSFTWCNVSTRHAFQKWRQTRSNCLAFNWSCQKGCCFINILWHYGHFVFYKLHILSVTNNVVIITLLQSREDEIKYKLCNNKDKQIKTNRALSWKKSSIVCLTIDKFGSLDYMQLCCCFCYLH